MAKRGSSPEFLTPQQEAGLADARLAIRRIDDIIDDGSPFDLTRVGLDFFSGMSEMVTLQRQSDRVDQNPRTPQAMELGLQTTAQRFVRTDIMRRGFTSVVALLTGVYEASHDDMEAVHGYNLGYEIVRQGGNWSAGTLTVATKLLTHSLVSLDEDASIWGQAAAVYQNNRKMHPPALIEKDEAEEFEDLRDRLFAYGENTPEQPETMKISRFKAVNVVRGLKAGAKMVRDNGGDMSVEGLSKMWQMQNVPPMELSDEELTTAPNIVHRMIKYIKRAGTVEPALTQDPRTQYVAYLADTLTSHHHEAEKAGFTRRVKTFVKNHQADFPHPAAEFEA